ncbi:MAG: zinc ABC transporter substrate-binding protein [Nitrospirae bacterium]|nr:zinc ABC transporter substrate-binding protein [Nitrospirota bacterium]MBI3351821.1 zinc ABC transporter substrate-binding protein [Nitrospirota bacterium]
MRLTAFLLFLFILTFKVLPSDAANEKLLVVSTVAPITNLIQNIAGSSIELHGIVPEGTDSHTFEPAPSDIKWIAAGDLFILNGLNLETPTEKLISSQKKKGAPVVKLGERVISQKDWIYDFSFPKEKGDPNPHLWLNVAYAMKYSEVIRDELIKIDPAHRTIYLENTEAFLKKLKQLDQVILETVQTIPPPNRRLVTYHDSWPYFASRYGFTVVGAVQPSSFSEPSARDVASLIDQLRLLRIPAIFGSEVFPSKVLNQIAREAGVKYVSTLRDDDLPGELSSPEHTYIGMMVENLKNIAVPLGGKPDLLKKVDPSNIQFQEK